MNAEDAENADVLYAELQSVSEQPYTSHLSEMRR